MEAQKIVLSLHGSIAFDVFSSYDFCVSDPILNEHGMTELLLAAYYGEVDWVQNCIVVGDLNVNARDNNRMTPLHWVVDMGMVGDSLEREEIVRFLIQKGAEVNAKDNAGESVISRAVLAGNLKLVQLLIDANADVNATDDFGRNPLTVAISNPNRKMTKIIERAGGKYPPGTA